MGSTGLAPLKRTLKKAYGLAANVEQETAGLVNIVDQASLDADEFEDHWNKAEAAARQFLQTIRIAHAKAAEIKELPSGADKVADAQLVAEGLDSLLAGMPAYQLARELEMVQLGHYLMTFTELASYEGGLERLTEIRDAAERTLREQGRKLAK